MNYGIIRSQDWLVGLPTVEAPIVNSNGEIAAAKALVYAGDPEELLLHHTGSIHISKRKDLLIISRASLFCYLSYYWIKRQITMYLNFIYSE
jgi:hypothetical protein